MRFILQAAKVWRSILLLNGLLVALATGLMTKNILVTGGCGNIGKELILTLLSGGYSVTNVDKFDGDHPKKPGYTFVHAGIMDEQLFQRIGDVSFDAVIHLAAETDESESINKVLDFHTTNVSGCLRMLEYTRKKGISHFILPSSGAVRDDKGAYVRTPRSPYVASKIAAEQFAEVHARLHGSAITVMRLFSLYGKGVCSRLQDMIESAMNDETVPLNKSMQEYYPVRVSEVVQVIMCALDRPNGFTVHELGALQSVKDEEVVELVGSKIGKHIRVDRVLEAPNYLDPRPMSGHTVKFLGIDAFSSLEDGLDGGSGHRG